MRVSSIMHTQNELLLNSLKEFYKNKVNLDKMMKIVNGKTRISLRIVDWFVTNYAKKYYTVYDITYKGEPARFKVYNEYKLKLKAYNKRRFDPFCRWDRTVIPYEKDTYMETTIGQLNFFKWAIENSIIEYIETNYGDIESDMNARNSTSSKKRKKKVDSLSSISSVSTSMTDTTTESMDTYSSENTDSSMTDNSTMICNASIGNNKTRKKREELSVFACKCIKKETVKVVVKFT